MTSGVLRRGHGAMPTPFGPTIKIFYKRLYMKRCIFCHFSSNLHSMLKISYAGCLSLFPAISAQFTFEMRVRPKIAKKFTKTPYFGSSRSFKVIDVDISKKLITSACYDKQHVCAYLQPFSC